MPNILPEAAKKATQSGKKGEWRFMDSHLENLQRELTGAIAGMSNEEMNWHPEGKWSTIQVLEHLYLTYTGTVKGFGKVLESGKAILGAPANLAQRGRTFVVVVLGYFPEGRKTPAVGEPRGLAMETVVPGVSTQIAEMDAVMRRCEEAGIRGKVLSHPILGPFSIPQWRKFHLVHGLHHVKQIRRLRSGAR